LGNPKNALPHSNSVVLELEWATKLFGESDPIGEMIEINTAMGTSNFEVTGVYDKNTYNSHLEPNYFISLSNSNWANFYNRFTGQWASNNILFTYLVLEEGVDAGEVNEKIDNLFQKHGAESLKEMGLQKVHELQAIQDIHTSSEIMMDMPGKTDKVFIQVLLTIGVLILILACVNYVNLSTAQAGKRALEVGIRKVMGITPRGLIIQFLGESFFIVFISILLSILIAELGLPIFNQLIETPLEFTGENISLLGGYLLVFLIFTSLVAGIYPAFYLSSFKPVSVLKGKSKNNGTTAVIRKILVTFQFVISIVLISAIIIISQQVDYLKNKDLGFESNTKLIIPLRTTEARGQYNALKLKFSSIAKIEKTSGASVIPGSPNLNDIMLYKQGQTMDDAVHIYNNEVDLDYVQTLGVDLIAGSYFEKYNTDTTRFKILINENACKSFGYEPHEAVGELVYFDWRGEKIKHEIVGVVRDIHAFSLHSEISPMLFKLGDSGRFDNIIIKANLNEFDALRSSLESDWDQLVVDTPFEYYTLDDHLNRQYESDFNTFNLIMYFAVISVMISCLGLYALSMFVAERRFKEIGVRKVLGANVKDVIILVSKDLSLLVIIAVLLSIPISIYGMNIWLDTFAYRITPGVMTYLIAGITSVLIGWITISYQSIRAATTNPVDVLKDE
jgi:putative ABC transport system permease protein